MRPNVAGQLVQALNVSSLLGRLSINIAQNCDSYSLLLARMAGKARLLTYGILFNNLPLAIRNKFGTVSLVEI